MRTVRSSGRLSGGGLPQCMLGYCPPAPQPPPPDQTPQDQAPPWEQTPRDQAPPRPGTTPPPVDRHTPVKT